MDIDDSLYIPPTKTVHTADKPAAKPAQTARVRRSDEDPARHEHAEQTSAECAGKPLELAADAVASVLHASEFVDFREPDQSEPVPQTTAIATSKIRVTNINRRYWGRHQQLERERKTELKAHGETGYRLPEDVLTKALRTRLDDLDSTDGIDKELRAAGVPEHKASSVKANTARCMKAALANLEGHPTWQMIQAEQLTKGTIRSSETVAAVMTSIRRSGLIAREIAALRSNVDDLTAWKAQAEPRLLAVEEAVGRKPAPKELALQMLTQGRTQQEVAAAVGTSTRTLIRWKKAFESAGKL